MDTRHATVLALLPGEYADILKKIYTHGSQELGWEIFVLNESNHTDHCEAYLKSKDHLLITPNVLQPQAWEQDQAVVTALQEQMIACERALGLPLNRIILSNERTMGRPFGKSHYYWAEGESAKLALRDNGCHQQLLMRLFKFAFDVIDRCRPQFCLGGPTGAMFNTVFFFVTHYRKIPYLSCNLPVASPDRHFWSSVWGSHQEQSTSQAFQEFSQGRKPTEAALQEVQAFQERPRPSALYENLWKKDPGVVTLKSVHRQIYRRILIRVIPLIRRQKISNPKPLLSFIVDMYRTYFLTRAQRKFYRRLSEQQLAETNYIYYPFHLDPEIVLNVRAPFWHHQLNTIKLLSANLPFNHKLLIREHRYNVGRRSTRYLREISRLPGVILIDAFDDQYKYIRHAKLVITVNGTTGFEGIILHRPVLMLAHTCYAALGIGSNYTSNVDFGELLLKALEKKANIPDNNEQIALYLDFEKTITIPRTATGEENIMIIESQLDAIFKRFNQNNEQVAASNSFVETIQ